MTPPVDGTPPVAAAPLVAGTPLVAGGPPIAASGLRRLLTPREPSAARPAGAPAAQPQRCDLCAEPLPPQHRHLADLEVRELRCACRACALLFDQDAAGGGHYRLVPDRRRHLPDLTLDDAAWSALRIPVELAFLFHDSAAGRTVAFYPSPAGAVESLLDLAAWRRVEAANPVLGELTQDVEALLVNRARGARDHWLVPIDDCYALVGLIRTRWQGLAGGSGVWEEIARFFADLHRRAGSRPAPTTTDHKRHADHKRQ